MTAKHQRRRARFIEKKKAEEKPVPKESVHTFNGTSMDPTPDPVDEDEGAPPPMPRNERNYPAGPAVESRSISSPEELEARRQAALAVAMQRPAPRAAPAEEFLPTPRADLLQIRFTCLQIAARSGAGPAEAMALARDMLAFVMEG